MKDKIKNKTRYIWTQLTLKYERWRERNFIKSSKLMYWFSLIVVALVISEETSRTIKPAWLVYLVVTSACIIIGIALKLVAVWILNLLLRNGIDELISALLIVLVAMTGISYIAFQVDHLSIIGVGVVVGLLMILFLKSLWSLVVGKLRTGFNLSVVIIGTVMIIGGISFLNSKGFEDTYIKTYLQLETKSPQLTAKEKEAFEEAVQGGHYTVLSATYDTKNADIISKTINLKSYASNKGVAGYIKEKYQGYGLNEVPIRGKIWYPKEAQNCPVLFMIHGNHNYVEESYLGYEYLGQYLASYGYVMVSVDQNACNMLTNENDARAILLLENMKAVQGYNGIKNNPIYKKIDFSKVGIAGHSRGGEAVSIAYLLNDEKVNPNNGKMKLDYHFDIRSIIAIAPTVDQYKPTSKSVQLEDVNYMILQGSNDQDLYNFSGMKQYKNIDFTGKGNYIKTSLYCAGCNHGQFNSRWGLYDREGIYAKALNVKNFVPQAEQEEIAKIFIKIFLDTTLREDTTYMNLLEDYRLYQSCLPETLYVQSYQKSDFKALCNFEEDTNLVTGTMKGVSIDVDGGSIWTEGLYPTEAAGSNSAIYLQWANQNLPTLRIAMPACNMINRTLQFDIMNLREDFKEKEASLLEAKITIEDATGQSATVLLSDYATVYPAFLVRLNKLEYLLGEIEYKHQFQTVSIPIASFTNVNPQLDVSRIIGLKINFTDEMGVVAIDEIGY